jgi:hypothetical protein
MYSNRNYVNFLPSNTVVGNAPTIRPEGLDSTDLILEGKGTGVLKFGTYVPGTTTANGYITIKSKDTSGSEITLKIPAQL